jgi:dihydrofolate reductase
MTIILTMAITANGIIASKTGSEDFFSHDNWIQFVKLAKRAGCFIWGRKTYETVISWEDDYLKDIEGVKKIILSKSNINLRAGFELAKSPAEALESFEKQGFNEVVISGGSNINSEFAKLGLIDEIIFDVNPSILGEGIQVFEPADFQLELELIDVGKISDDIVELRYKVKK